MRSITFRFSPIAICSVSAAALLGLPVFVTSPAMAQTTQLPGVTIYSTTPQILFGTGEDGETNAVPSSTDVEDPDSPSRPPSIGDSGKFLRQVNGVDAARMGGHGLDPVIRGLDQNAIAVTNDGAYHFGGCPNRMDPPTSHMQLYTYDKVVVKKGFQSVLDGPPAPGGTIQFERVNPIFTPGMEVSTNFMAGTGYNSNGNGIEAFTDMSMGNDWGYIRGFGSYATSDNYEDGDGNEVRSSFDQFGGGIILGRTFDRDSWLTFKVENNNVDDVLYPGAGMDAPKTDDWTYQIKGETDVDWGIIKGVKGDIYLTTVDHTMNNFDLRPAAGNFMEARTESDTAGGKMVFNGQIGNTTFDIGSDYRDIMRDGTKYAGPNGTYDPVLISSTLWPDTSIKELGIFGETVTPLTPTTKMTVGMRYSYVNASADNIEEATTFGPVMGATPESLYNIIYGADASDDKTENNFSGLVRLEQEMGGGVTLFGALSRSVRTADASERYLFNLMGMGSQCGGGPNAGCTSWIGNPDIDPEKHHQVDLGMTYKGQMFDLKGSVYYNRVTDFIQLYSDQYINTKYHSVSIYKNIDATLAGVEAEAELRLTPVWRVGLAGAYTYGQNETDDTPLAQIPPFSGRFELVYDDSKFMAGARINAASKQNRTDENSSGIDSGKTPGWMTVDVFGSYNLSENFQLSAGVTNVFDEDYANHLNKTDPLGINYQVDEPGRSFYVRAVTKF